MYDGTYDNYIRSVLGYQQNEIYDYGYNNYRVQQNENIVRQNTKLEQCYPEIYKIVYPMVSKRCQNVRGELTNEEIENMTDEIYLAFEGKNDVQLNINLTNNVRTTQENTNIANKKAEVKVSENTNEKRETRQINRGLRDLIKILLIRELLNRPGHFPIRPPVRPPMRPPFGPGGRPPFPREFEVDNYDLYEM